jgi:hypothetical protein
MLTGPQVPQFQGPDFFASLGGFPLRVEITPLGLGIMLVLAGVLTAAVTVVLMYHWRRFPFEHTVFRHAELLYLIGVVLLLSAAVIGTLLSV